MTHFFHQESIRKRSLRTEGVVAAYLVQFYPNYKYDMQRISKISVEVV